MKNIITSLVLLCSICLSAQEICNNALDDDGDGLIDLNDPDCNCGNQTPVPSIIPNASFEEHSECPWSFSQLNLCEGWVQATDATTDYYNTCGTMAPGLQALSDVLMPFPDGEGITAAIFKPDWNEYLGSCLLAPMVADTPYQLTFNIASMPISNDGSTCNDNVIDYDPVNVTIYGTQNCINLPLSTVFSPDMASTEWVELGRASYNPQSHWGQLTISFTPTDDIKAIMIGAPRTLPPAYSVISCYAYFLFDNLILNEASKFDVHINATGDYCNSNLVLASSLSVTVSDEATFQWYKDGIAIVGATQSTYAVEPGSGPAEYRVKVTDGAECYLSPGYIVNNFNQEPDITVVQPNCISDGTITVNTPADFYSFDNGVTWSASNVSGLLPSGIYAVKTKTVAGCTSMASIANLSYFSNLDYINYTSVNPQCGVLGSITITAPAALYSFDGGATWETSDTKQLDYGMHHIMIKDDTGCSVGENYVYLPQPFFSPPSFTPYNITCGSLGSITIDTVTDFYSIDGGDTWSTSNTFSSLTEGYYFVTVKDASGCQSQPLFVYIGVEDIYAPATDNTVIYCQGATATALTAVGTDILWYDTPIGGTPLSAAPVPDTSTVGNAWYYASQTVRACESQRTAVHVTVLATPDVATATQYYEYCKDEPTTALTATGVGLTWYTTPDGGIGSATAPVPPSDVPGTFYYYVCQSVNGCESPRITITVVIHPIPPVPVTDTKIQYEQYDPVQPLMAIGENIVWYDSNFDALSEKPVITSDELGKTVYYVSQTINNCTSSLHRITVVILPNYITIKYPNYFTPNGDGTHETWNIYKPEFGIKATVYIFDRYGKLITTLFSPGSGWDGTLNGAPLPSTDYWFKVYYTEYGVAKTFGAHFSLVR
ncbi:T9SS type B sorting domain-containing protein [Flavobacterium sp. RHBU_3]|uniref:T9SS type B sorting domain-containing protein n=1 Tax=Flavobacterium sp. RHBU_3 TaxID=3391184 RepID=UPI00398496F8